MGAVKTGYATVLTQRTGDFRYLGFGSDRRERMLTDDGHVASAQTVVGATQT